MNINDIVSGFLLFLDWHNIVVLILGVCGGMLVGALPGMGSVMLCALVIPFTYTMAPQTALILLIAIYCSSVYGGSIGAVLFNIPGTGSASATALEGYPMSQKGLGGHALITVVLSSGLGGIFGWLGLFLFAPPLARWSIAFGPAEYCMLGVFGLTIIGLLSGKDPIKGLISGCLGMIIAQVGMAPPYATYRFTFGILELTDGVDLILVIIGLFAFSQAFALLRHKQKAISETKEISWSVPKAWMDIMGKKYLALWSSFIGLIIGAIPGTGASVAAWVAYNESMRFSKEKDKFGTGVIDGLIAPECANNSAACGALIPMMALGLPGSSTTAIILGGMMMAGLTPGPRLFTDQGPVTYSIFFGTLAANLLFVVVALVALKYVVRVLTVPVPIIIPAIIVLCSVGAYAISYSLFGVYVAFILGIFAYILKQFNFPVPPILIGVILGRIVEANLHRALMISHGDLSIFVSSPISIGLIVLTVISVFTTTCSKRNGKKLVIESK